MSGSKFGIARRVIDGVACRGSVDAPLNVVVMCPSLSLQHEHVESKSAGTRSREQVAGHAASLMARQEAITLSYSEGSVYVINHKEEQLLDNIYRSFTILVYSRVRAYAAMISRGKKNAFTNAHAETAQSCIGEKLERLVNAATAIRLDNMATTFELERVNLDEENSVTPILFGLIIELDLPASKNDEREPYKMSIRVPGEIRGKKTTSLLKAFAASFIYSKLEFL